MDDGPRSGLVARLDFMSLGRLEFRTRSLSGTLESIADSLPSALVSRAALSHAASRCGDLPAALAKYIGFECRLSPRSSRVDLMLDVDNVGRAIIVGKAPGVYLPDRVWNSPQWALLRRFCRQWGRDGSVLAKTIDHIWLEFDLRRAGDDHERGHLPVPGIFLGFGKVRSPRLFSSPRWLAVVRKALTEISGTNLPLASDRMLERCFDGLPAGAKLPFVGMMFQRPDAGVRLCIKHLCDEAILEYVKELSWPGSILELSDLLAGVRAARRNAENPGAAMVHLDVGTRMGPAIGLEYSLERWAQVVDGCFREASFLDYLVNQDYCSPTQRDALEAWPGVMKTRTRYQLWTTLVVRTVNHIKLVYRSGHPLEVKAYPGVEFAAITKRGRVTLARRVPGILRS